MDIADPSNSRTKSARTFSLIAQYVCIICRKYINLNKM